MDQDTTTTPPPDNGFLPVGDPRPHCARQQPPVDADDFGGLICLAAAGHAGPHMAYGPDGELCGSWPQTPPIQPVTLTLAELTAIKTTLTERAHALRKRADSRRGPAAQFDRAVDRAVAGKYDDIAARLSFAVPGEPIQVVDSSPVAIAAHMPGGNR